VKGPFFIGVCGTKSCKLYNVGGWGDSSQQEARGLEEGAAEVRRGEVDRNEMALTREKRVGKECRGLGGERKKRAQD